MNIYFIQILSHFCHTDEVTASTKKQSKVIISQHHGKQQDNREKQDHKCKSAKTTPV